MAIRCKVNYRAIYADYFLYFVVLFQACGYKIIPIAIGTISH